MRFGAMSDLRLVRSVRSRLTRKTGHDGVSDVPYARTGWEHGNNRAACRNVGALGAAGKFVVFYGRRKPSCDPTNF
ncbi:hypothetical protein J2W46_003086 [Paraburkholderia strydomiana]|nr:hypothetical protein [Paraburkholderia strydomiana]